MQPNEGIHLHHDYPPPMDEDQQISHEIPADAITEPEQIRKVFIGGLGQQVTGDHLDAYFSNFGRLTDCVVMKDPNGRSRGFGFVTFTHKHMVDACMASRPHVIEGKEVDAKRAMPKDDSSQGPAQQINVRKLFVGGIRDGLEEEDLRCYFSKYGVITDCVVMRNGEGVVRGFGFVQFSDSDAVDQVVLQRRHMVKGQDLDVKKAIPKAPTQTRGAYRSPRRGGGQPRFYDSSYNDSFQMYSDYQTPGYMQQQQESQSRMRNLPAPQQHNPYSYEEPNQQSFRQPYRGRGPPYTRNAGPYDRRVPRPQRYYRGSGERRY